MRNNTPAMKLLCLCAWAILTGNIPSVLYAQFYQTNTATESNSRIRDSIDVVLVIDRSLSMSDNHNIENAKIAASTFVGFMQIGDALGIVSFNQRVQTDFPFNVIVSEATKAEAQLAIDSIRADGFTCIGSAMQVGQIELNKSNRNHARAMLLLSDGKENIPPYAEDVLADILPGTDIYTIGLGFDADGALLNLIAAKTGGIYLYVPSSKELQHFYVLLRGKIGRLQTISSFADTVSQGETQFHSFALDSLTSQAIFSVTFQHGDLDLQLVTPGGGLIDPQVAAADTNISYFEGSVFDYYVIDAPEAGAWQLQVSGSNVRAPELYSAVVLVFSALQTELTLGKNEYDAGEPILIITSLEKNGQQFTGAAMTAEVKSPKSSVSALRKLLYRSAFDEERSAREQPAVQVSSYGSPEISNVEFDLSTITLFDDGLHNDGSPGDGVYANYFRNTLNDGNYTITTHARGNLPKSGVFMRENTISTYVKPSTAPAVVSVSPDSGRPGETPTLIITGANFDAGAHVAFSGNDVTIISDSVESANRIVADIAVAPDASPGYQNITVTNSDGRQGIGPGIFRVIEVPEQFELLQNYPNPFNPATTISYKLPEATEVKLEILNIIGQHAITLVNSTQRAGLKSIVWDGRDNKGRQLPSGVYFYRLTTPSIAKTKKLLLLR